MSQWRARKTAGGRPWVRPGRAPVLTWSISRHRSQFHVQSPAADAALLKIGPIPPLDRPPPGPVAQPTRARPGARAISNSDWLQQGRGCWSGAGGLPGGLLLNCAYPATGGGRRAQGARPPRLKILRKHGSTAVGSVGGEFSYLGLASWSGAAPSLGPRVPGGGLFWRMDVPCRGLYIVYIDLECTSCTSIWNCLTSLANVARREALGQMARWRWGVTAVPSGGQGVQL
jgi:hypothetical protein